MRLKTILAITLCCLSIVCWGQSDSIVIEYLHNNGIETSRRNNIRLLKSGREKFEDLFASIRQAKHHIHLEYFNFRNDSIATLTFKLLEQKASEGIEVRAMFDAFGNMSNNQPLREQHLEALREKGIEIVKYDPIRFPWFNHVLFRDHRKIVVIDGMIAYTGGMNIADYYVNGLPEIGPWRDMHTRIEGEAVNVLQEIFLSMWNKCTYQDISGEKYYPLRRASYIDGDKRIAIVNRWPRKSPKLLRRAYAKAIDAATRQVRIINPYFTPTHMVRKALKKAIRRGVNVEIMISAKSDIPFSPEGCFYVANQLRKLGAHVYVYDEGFHHSKIMMVDNLFCTVGSTNLDSRSLRFDHEVNAFIFDKTTTNDLNDVFDTDIGKSTLLTSESYKERPAWKRFQGWAANVLTPFL